MSLLSVVSQSASKKVKRAIKTKEMKKLKLKTKYYEDLEQGYEEWLKLLGYSEGSVSGFPAHVREFFHWLESKDLLDLRRVSEKEVSSFMDYFSSRPNQRLGGGLSHSHINKQILTLKLLGKYVKLVLGVELKVRLNYVKKEQLKERAILSKEEVKGLYECCGQDYLGQRDRAMLSIYYGCGLRRSEGVNLNVEDVLFERGLLHVKKTKNRWERYVPMALRVRQDLERYIYSGRKMVRSNESPENLFLTSRGKGAKSISLMHRLKSLVEQCSLPRAISFHNLRHSIATHLLEGGMELEEVADFLGHRSLDSSQIYTHVKSKSWKKN